MTATLSKTHAHTSARPRNKTLHIALWVVQVMLALAFGMAGVMKSTQPIDALRTSMAWVAAVPPGMVRFIGVSEFLGAIGILIPALTRMRIPAKGSTVPVIGSGSERSDADRPAKLAWVDPMLNFWGVRPSAGTLP